ncbi:MAG: fumarylacetoacetate hydrolase family protein [Chitinophagaceae bacterium]|uniref:fumarylacetoacetate hydrolase family protein n=1 Tax=unclassified Paraflavitalea TaxID=2798305 RepID=UPI003D33DDAE|nr:fumarylacetoacetate hydrolase family protein [Chitinophagaceae bacterium]
MKILYFRENGALKLGIATDKGVLDIDLYRTANGFKPFATNPITVHHLEALNYALQNAPIQFYKTELSLAIGPCTPNPQKIICIGLNYRKHAIESGMAIPTIPVVFTKYNNTLVDYGKDVELGKVGVQFDYEVELGVVIGKKAKNVSKEEALSYVLGYCVSNDLSCRDLQFRTSQWLMGKSLDHFLPLGKYVVTSDEVGDPQQLALQSKVNGELRQNSNTADMIFNVAEIIEDLSKHFTLEPGDLILTGTPEGVAMGITGQPWLKPNDVVEVSIENIGSTVNTMI